MKKYDWFCLIFLFVVLLVGYVLLCILLPISFKNALSYVANLAAIAAAISIYFAIKSANLAKQSFDKTVEKWETEENNKVIAMVNALLEELHINFRICSQLFFENFSWENHYKLFRELFDVNNIEYSNPTDDFNETRNKTMRMLSIFYKIDSKCEFFEKRFSKEATEKYAREDDFSNSKFYGESLREIRYYIAKGQNDINEAILKKLTYDFWLLDVFDNKTEIKFFKGLVAKGPFVTLGTKVIILLSNSENNIVAKGPFVTLGTKALENILGSGHFLASRIPNRNRLFVNMGQLNFSIDSKYNKRINETEINEFVSVNYLLWTHFRLVFLILDILESFNHRRDDLINTKFINEIYEAMENVNPELKKREEIDRESTTSKTS